MSQTFNIANDLYMPTLPPSSRRCVKSRLYSNQVYEWSITPSECQSITNPHTIEVSAHSDTVSDDQDDQYLLEVFWDYGSAKQNLGNIGIVEMRGNITSTTKFKVQETGTPISAAPPIRVTARYGYGGMRGVCVYIEDFKIDGVSYLYQLTDADGHCFKSYPGGYGVELKIDREYFIYPREHCK